MALAARPPRRANKRAAASLTPAWVSTRRHGAARSAPCTHVVVVTVAPRSVAPSPLRASRHVHTRTAYHDGRYGAAIAIPRISLARVQVHAVQLDENEYYPVQRRPIQRGWVCVLRRTHAPTDPWAGSASVGVSVSVGMVKKKPTESTTPPQLLFGNVFPLSMPWHDYDAGAGRPAWR